MAFNFDIDRRDPTGGFQQRPVTRKRITVTVLAGKDVAETIVPLNMTLRRYHFWLPTLDSGDTAELKIRDEYENPYITPTGEKAQATIPYNYTSDVDLAGDVHFRVETSSTQDADRVFYIDIYGR